MPKTSAQEPIQPPSGASQEGSKLFTGIDNSYLAQHLTDQELAVLHGSMTTGFDLSKLTNAQVVDLFP